MAPIFIYALLDPRTGEIRYLGQTAEPDVRLRAHIRNAKIKNCYSACWLRSLRATGLKPIMEILDVVPDSEADFWETEYIQNFRERGFKLTNFSDGGRVSMRGKTHSPESRAKMCTARARQIITPEHCAAIGASHLGKKRSPEACANISAAQKGKKIAPEQRAKISAALVGKKLSLRHCANMRVKRPLASSKFHGVFKKRAKWRARLVVSGKRFYLGEFLNETEAAKAYDVAAKKYCGIHAVLNFPNG